MGIIRSEKRPAAPIGFQIKEDVTLTATGAVNITVPFIVDHVDFFPSSFRLDVRGRVVVFDPLVVGEEGPADFILITHAHSDHFSVCDIRKLLKRETILICPEHVCKKLSGKLGGCTVKKTEPGERLEIDGIIIETVAAYNMKSGLVTPHPKSAKNVGYVVAGGNVRVYHAGDTDHIPEMRRLKDIDAALTPIDGGRLTMTTEKAAEFINLLKPVFAVPMHYNLGTAEVGNFRKLVGGDTQVVVLDGQG